MSDHSAVLRETASCRYIDTDIGEEPELWEALDLAADVLDAIPDKDDPVGWVQRQVDKVEMTVALESAGLLRDEYPDQMAARSCTCEPDAVCGAHRLFARYVELNAAFVQRGKERREVQAELRELRDAIPGDDKLAVAEWAVKIAAETINCRTTDEPAALTRFYDAWDSLTPSVRAALRSGEVES